MKSLSKFVVFSFASLILYTIISQVIAFKTGMELSTLTTCFFGAFGGEVLMCALIKIFKLRGGDRDGNNPDITADMQRDDIVDNGSDQENGAG